MVKDWLSTSTTNKIVILVVRQYHFTVVVCLLVPHIGYEMQVNWFISKVGPSVQ